MTRRRTSLTVAALSALMAGALTLTACSNDTASTAKTKSGTLKIAFIPGITTDGFFVAMQHAAEKQAKDLNVQLNYTGPTVYSYAAQTQVFNSVLATRPDGIIFASTDAKAMEAPVRQAKAAGIPVITVDSTIANQDLIEARISTSDESGGKLAADQMAKLVGDSGKVAVVGYIPGITTTDARTKAFIDELRSGHPNIEVLGTQFSSGQLTKAATITTGLVDRYVDLKGIFVVNDLNAAGVVNGLKSVKKIGAIKVVAYDAEPDEIGFLKEGSIQATVVQKPSEEAAIALRLMTELLHNGTAPSPKTQLLDPVVATPENMNDPAVSQYFYQ